MSEPQRPNLRLGSPADLVTVVPYVLGYHATDSLVVLALTDKRILFAARLDLPTEDPAIFDQALHQVIRVAVRQGTHVMLVGYGELAPVTTALHAARTAFTHAGLTVAESLRVTDGRYYSHTCTNPVCCPPTGQPMPDTPAAVAEAVYAGMVALPSRDDVAQRIAALTGDDAQRMAQAVRRAAQDLDAQLAAAVTGHANPAEAGLRFLTDLAIPTIEQAADRYQHGGRLDDDETALLLLLLRHQPAHDHALFHTDGQQLDLWTDLTRRAPNRLVGAPGTVLAWSALRAGQGGLANLALERVLAADPGNTLADALWQIAMLGPSPDDLATLVATTTGKHPVPPTP